MIRRIKSKPAATEPYSRKAMGLVAAKPITMWAVISNHLNAVPIVQCVAYERKWAIASALSDWETWPGLHSQGYRCVKVRVEVIE